MTEITTISSGWAEGFNLLWFIREVLAGILLVLVLVWFHGYTLFRIHLRYLIKGTDNFKHGRVNSVALSFYGSILLLLLVHFVEIIIGAMSLLLLGIDDNLAHALIMAGSTYTTVGFVSDTMPLGWKLYPVFMAITGLFNFAWSTGVMMSMTNLLRASLLKKLKIEALPQY